MGQKVRPTGFRVGIMTGWKSSWYASKADFSDLLVEDQTIRKYIKKHYGGSGISKIKIHLTREKVTVFLHAARVGMIIGKKGQEIDKLTKELEDLCHRHIEIKTIEVNRPEVDPQLVAEDIAERALHLAQLPPIPIPEKLQHMTNLTTQMVRQSLDCFVNLDTRQARVVCQMDDEVDHYNKEIIDELLVAMRESAEMVEPGLSLFSATRHLERIADHATNIAEDVVYLVEGEIIRHRPVEVTKV